MGEGFASNPSPILSSWQDRAALSRKGRGRSNEHRACRAFSEALPPSHPGSMRHWALMFASLMTCPHFSISERRNEASASGVEPTTTPLLTFFLPAKPSAGGFDP